MSNYSALCEYRGQAMRSGHANDTARVRHWRVRLARADYLRTLNYRRMVRANAKAAHLAAKAKRRAHVEMRTVLANSIQLLHLATECGRAWARSPQHRADVDMAADRFRSAFMAAVRKELSR